MPPTHSKERIVKRKTLAERRRYLEGFNVEELADIIIGMENANARPNARIVKAWADIGSHGGIFEFQLGPVASRYPHLMHVYSKQVTFDLVPITIHLPAPRKVTKKRT